MSYDSLLLIKRKWMENIVLDMLRLRAQYFFAKHLSPITIFWKKSDKLLVIKGTICVTDTKNREFIPHASLTIWASSLTILPMLLSKKAFLRLKLASFAFEVSFISNWFEA